jgi:hypothetical protein
LGKNRIASGLVGESVKILHRIIALLWIAVPPVILSALIHMADPDIGGWRGLASFSVLWSVMFFGILAVAFTGYCLVILLEHGRVAFVIGTGLFAAMSGFVLVALGSGATTALGLIWSFTGIAALVFCAVVSAVIPAVVLGWPQASTRQAFGPDPQARGPR